MEAAAAGLLDETTWVELKEAIPAASKGANLELAKDLASLSVDGGVLIVGIVDNKGSAGDVTGTELAGLADRVDQVARGTIHPGLFVSIGTIEHPEKPGVGVVVISVHASSAAPHMVDGAYWGRGDAGKRRLTDPEVTRLFELRRLTQNHTIDKLRALESELDPLPPEHRLFGHLYVLVEPSMAVETTGRQLRSENAMTTIRDALGTFSPNWDPGFRRSLGRAVPLRDGWATEAMTGSDGEIASETYLLRVVAKDSAEVQVVSGAGTRDIGTRTDNVGVPTAVYTSHIIEIVHSAIMLSSHLSQGSPADVGNWRVAAKVDGLQGVMASDAYGSGVHGLDGYQGSVYEHLADTTASEMAERPQDIVNRVVAPLLRGLGVEGRYLPYDDPNRIGRR